MSYETDGLGDYLTVLLTVSTLMSVITAFGSVVLTVEFDMPTYGCLSSMVIFLSER